MNNEDEDFDSGLPRRENIIRSLVSALGYNCPYNHGTHSTLSLKENEIILSSIPSFNFPSMNLFQSNSFDSIEAENNIASSLNSPLCAKSKAVQNLTKSLNYRASKVQEVPSTITNSLLQCFASIIEANLYQYFKRNVCSGSSNRFDNQRARRLSSSYFGKNNKYTRNNIVFTPILLESGSTSFTTSSKIHLSGNIFTVPVTFASMLTLKVRGQLTRLEISCAGCIEGKFDSGKNDSLDYVDLRINTQDLLTLLRQEARKIILTAISFRRNLDQLNMNKYNAPELRTPRFLPMHMSALINKQCLFPNSVNGISEKIGKKRKLSMINETFVLPNRKKVIKSYQMQLLKFSIH